MINHGYFTYLLIHIMKKIIYIIILLQLYINWVFATEPTIECSWLPWCGTSSKSAFNFIWHIVAELIKYVAVVAVFSVIAAGFMYIFSAGEDEKTKNARKWIIWSLVWVLVSVSAYLMINMINDANINI